MLRQKFRAGEVRMDREYVLGMDMGGTHTDAVLLALDQSGKNSASTAAASLAAACKVRTRHENLPVSVREALQRLASSLREKGLDADSIFARIRRVTLGATLAVNALVQNRADRVGLLLSGGPGLDPLRAALGEDVCLVPGGLDHRGEEVSPLCLAEIPVHLEKWRKNGVAAVACVGKFSPRNPVHEQGMAGAVRRADADLPVSMGHTLSGGLNFPRRVATAFFGAAVARMHNAFLDAVRAALEDAGIGAPVFLLKADGGSAPLRLARGEPAQSILSGPAASVMGVLALCGARGEMAEGCSLLLDMGGTTTDVALLLDGSPVVDRDGMRLQGRRTLVRALASVSVGVGGDSQLHAHGAGAVRVGPERMDCALAFGGKRPTLLDAFNLCNQQVGGDTAGDVAASERGLAALAQTCGLRAEMLARRAVDNALEQVAAAVRSLVDQVNARPVYTLAALKAAREARPERAWLVGGPAACVAKDMARALGLPVEIPAQAHVANAVGAALTLPSASLEAYADTGRRILHVPALGLTEAIGRDFAPDSARRRACELLEQKLADAGVCGARVEVVGTEVFATLDAGDRGSRDIRVACQTVPGIAAHVLPSFQAADGGHHADRAF